MNLTYFLRAVGSSNPSDQKNQIAENLACEYRNGLADSKIDVDCLYKKFIE